MIVSPMLKDRLFRKEFYLGGVELSRQDRYLLSNSTHEDYEWSELKKDWTIFWPKAAASVLGVVGLLATLAFGLVMLVQTPAPSWVPLVVIGVSTLAMLYVAAKTSVKFPKSPGVCWAVFCSRYGDRMIPLDDMVMKVLRRECKRQFTVSYSKGEGCSQRPKDFFLDLLYDDRLMKKYLDEALPIRDLLNETDRKDLSEEDRELYDQLVKELQLRVAKPVVSGVFLAYVAEQRRRESRQREASEACARGKELSNPHYEAQVRQEKELWRFQIKCALGSDQTS